MRGRTTLQWKQKRKQFWVGKKKFSIYINKSSFGFTSNDGDHEHWTRCRQAAGTKTNNFYLHWTSNVRSSWLESVRPSQTSEQVKVPQVLLSFSPAPDTPTEVEEIRERKYTVLLSKVQLTYKLTSYLAANQQVSRKSRCHRTTLRNKKHHILTNGRKIGIILWARIYLMSYVVTQNIGSVSSLLNEIRNQSTHLQILDCLFSRCCFLLPRTLQHTNAQHTLHIHQSF